MGIELIEVIVAGPQGPAGTPGTSTTAGGLTHEVLTKLSNVDYDADWALVNAANTIFTSTSGITATTIAEALDEVNTDLQSTTSSKADKAQTSLTTTTYEDATSALTYKIYMNAGELILEEL